jgi:hypothetical protein
LASFCVIERCRADSPVRLSKSMKKTAKKSDAKKAILPVPIKKKVSSKKKGM